MGDTEANLIQIAERLRAAREYMGLSQAEIGQITGLESADIVDLESGAREIEDEELNLLSKKYRRSAEYLLTGSEPAYAGPEQFSFLARATRGLSAKDKEEVAQFAEFLRASDAS